MLRLTRIARRPAVALAVAGGASACLFSSSYLDNNELERGARCEAPNASQGGLKEVAKRLGAYVKNIEDEDKITLRTDKLGVKVYGVVDEAAHKAAGGLPVVRVAQALIKAPIEDVALCWWQAGRRKEWDSVNTQDSQLVRSVAPNARLVYLQGKPKKGGIISSRDFCYVSHKAPPELVGAKAGSVLFVQANAATEVPPNNASTRGDVNSLLLLVEVDPITTRAYYAIELDVKGWLPIKVVKAAADETPLTLAVLRDYIEKELSEEASLTPEAAAKHAVHRRESGEDKPGAGAIAGAWATREDLLETKKLLEKQLKKASAEERKMGIDLSGLRKQIKKEIAEVDRRL
ncbi:unnamed protein product [Pylaiella littoralis]